MAPGIYGCNDWTIDRGNWPLVAGAHRSAKLNRAASCRPVANAVRVLLTQLLARKSFKVVAVALANKMARIAWALLVKGGPYRARALVAAA